MICFLQSLGILSSAHVSELGSSGSEPYYDHAARQARADLAGAVSRPHEVLVWFTCIDFHLFV